MPDQIEYSRVYRVPAPLLFRPRVYGPSRARVQERAGTSETNTLSGRPLLFHSSFRTNDFHSRVAKIRNSRLSKFFFISNFTELVRRRYYCSVSVGERMVLIVASIVPFQRRGIRNDARPRDTIKERERESLRVVGLLTFPGARFWHRDPTFFVRPTDISLHSHAWNESRATRSPSPPRNAPPLCKARDPRAVDHVALVIRIHISITETTISSTKSFRFETRTDYDREFGSRIIFSRSGNSSLQDGRNFAGREKFIAARGNIVSNYRRGGIVHNSPVSPRYPPP